MLAGAVARASRAPRRTMLLVRGVSVAQLDDGRAPASSVALVALLPPRVAVVVVAVALPEARARPRACSRGRAPTSRSSRSRGAARAAAPARRARVPAARRRSSKAIHARPPREVLERQVGRVAAVGERHHVARRRSRRRRAACRSTTPRQTVSSFDHFVTQWMSTVIASPAARELAPGPRRGSSIAPRS